MVINMKIETGITKYRELIIYGLFGLLSTMINIVSYYILAHILGIDTMPSTLLAWIIAVTFAYMTNRSFVFHSKVRTVRGIIKEVYSFIGCRLGTELFDLIAMFIFVTQLGYNDIITKGVANVIVIILNYAASKLWIFKN